MEQVTSTIMWCVRFRYAIMEHRPRIGTAESEIVMRLDVIATTDVFQGMQNWFFRWNTAKILAMWSSWLYITPLHQHNVL